MQFYFKDNKETKKSGCLIFCQKDKIIRYDYKQPKEEEKVKIYYMFP